jgi:hypothetical protein
MRLSLQEIFIQTIRHLNEADMTEVIFRIERHWLVPDEHEFC